MCIRGIAIQSSHLIAELLTLQGMRELAEASHPGFPRFALVCGFVQQLSCILQQTSWHMTLSQQTW